MSSARFTTLWDLHKYRADALICCRSCRHKAVVLRSELLARFGLRRFSATWHRAERSLVCSRCGARGQRLVPVPERGRPPFRLPEAEQ